jgi:hypothetical protein
MPGGAATAGLFHGSIQVRGSTVTWRDVTIGFVVMRIQLLPLQ